MLRAAATVLKPSRTLTVACVLFAACALQPPAGPPPVGEAAIVEANRKADAQARGGNLEVAARHFQEDADAIAANAISLSIVYQRLGKHADARASLAPLLEQSRLNFSPDRLAQAALRRPVLDLDGRRLAKPPEWIG